MRFLLAALLCPALAFAQPAPSPTPQMTVGFSTAGATGQYNTVVANQGAAGQYSWPMYLTGTVTPLDGALTTGTATSASALAWSPQVGASTAYIDTAGYESIAVTLTVPASATVVPEGSNDGTTWVTQGNGFNNTGGYGAGASFSSGTAVIVFPATQRYFRLRASAYTSGTVTAVVALRSASMSGANVSTAINGTAAVAAKPATSGGLTMARVILAASTNSTLVKNAAGQLYSYDIGNSDTVAIFVKFYNTSTAPTCGSGTPQMTITVPAGYSTRLSSDIGYAFASGIGLCVTGAAADADTTATSASKATISLGYN